MKIRIDCICEQNRKRNDGKAYRASHNYRNELEPKFYSDASSFQVTLYNSNYGQTTEKAVVSDENQLFETLHLGLKVKTKTKETMVELYRQFGFDTAFARSDTRSLQRLSKMFPQSA